MKTLFDTNVILDVLLDREPFSNDASLLLSKVEQSEIVDNHPNGATHIRINEATKKWPFWVSNRVYF